jgi:hypothetical protein
MGRLSAAKYVVTHRPIPGDSEIWKNSIRLDGDVVKEIKKLRNEDGPEIQVHGSSNPIQTLFKNDLVDELWAKIFPLTLGTGKRLFGDGKKVPKRAGESRGQARREPAIVTDPRPLRPYWRRQNDLPGARPSFPGGSDPTGHICGMSMGGMIVPFLAVPPPFFPFSRNGQHPSLHPPFSPDPLPSWSGSPSFTSEPLTIPPPAG